MPSAARRTKQLTRQEIAAAALSIVDAEGLASLTMRSLGRSLKCDPMAVYHHVANRNELLTLVAQSVLDEIEVPSARLGDRRWVISLGHELRAVLHRHPETASLFGHSQISTGIAWELLDGIVERLDRHEHKAAVVDRLNALIGAIIGYVSVELSPSTGVRREVVLEDDDRYENLARHKKELLGHAFGMRPDEGATTLLPGGFDLMLSVLVDGVLTQQ